MQHTADRPCQQADPESAATRDCTSVPSQPLGLSSPSGAPPTACAAAAAHPRVRISSSPSVPHLSSSSCWAAHRPTWRLAAVRRSLAAAERVTLEALAGGRCCWLLLLAAGSRVVGAQERVSAGVISDWNRFSVLAESVAADRRRQRGADG